MFTIIFVFIGAFCISLGIRVLNARERNKIFNKRHIEVTDVKKYNRLCGSLIIGFGIVADITLILMMYLPGIIGSLLTFAVIGEAALVMVLYNRIEKKLIKK